MDTPAITVDGTEGPATVSIAIDGRFPEQGDIQVEFTFALSQLLRCDAGQIVAESEDDWRRLHLPKRKKAS